MTSVRDVDGRSDIWALGIILFELISGSVPFMGETLPQVCGLVLQSEAPRLSSRRADVPSELDAVVARCLAKSADQRYQNVAELAVALRGFAGRYGRASVERILMLAGGDEPAPPATPKVEASAGPSEPLVQAASVIQGTHAAWGETRPPVPGKRRPPFALVAGLILVPVLGASAWWGLRSHPEVSPSPQGSVTVVTGAGPAPSAPLELSDSAVPPLPPSAAPDSAEKIAPVLPGKPAATVSTSAAMKKHPVPAKSANTPAPKPDPVATPVVIPKPAVAVSPKPAASETQARGMGGRL
jgi:serine/threonine-protein kinase